MSSFLGLLGGLVGFKCPSSLVSSSSRSMVERVSTSGVVRVQVSPRAAREWRVDWGVATPAELSSLAALVAGEFGYGPFWFVDPWAQVTNVMDARASVSEWTPGPGTTSGGPAAFADGTRVGRTVVVENPAAVVLVPRLGDAFHFVPVVPGLPVTGSVWAAGASVQIRLQWYDASGSAVGSSTSYATFTPGSTMNRIHRTAVAPVGAASVLIGVVGASRLARPAVTWTDTLMDWHVGQGASSVAIPAELSQDIILATREAREHGRLASVSTTIREIG